MRRSWKTRAMVVVLSAAMISQNTVTGLTVNASETTDEHAGFETEAVLNLEKTAGISIGTPNPDGGVAEIVAYNSDNQKAYVVNGQEGVLNVLPMNEEGDFTESQKIEVKELIEGFSYGDMTSVSVDTVHDRIAIALQAENYADKGQVAVLDYDGNLIQNFEVGVQPDMVTFTKDGNKLLTADEGEPREGYGEGTVDPAGSVSVVDLQQESVQTIGFGDFDATELAEQGILFNKVNDEIVPAETDLEPEYIAVKDDGSMAYVSLQEANAIAVLDLSQMKFTEIRSLGFQDFSKEENAIDLVDDGSYIPKQYENALGVRMPDGISIYEQDGKTYLLTANEGDAREWGTEDTPQYFINEAKATLTATDETPAGKVRVLDEAVTAGLEEGKQYLFGSRSFSVLDADTMEVVYDSANGFEQKTAEALPEYFNCSNDDTEIDSRSQKKGPEPETVTIGAVGGKTFAFITLERIGGVMVYDITEPAASTYVNYINTRDFSDTTAGDVAPEGLAFIPANKSSNGQPMILAACEVSGSVVGYSLGGTAAQNVVVLYTNDVHCAIDGYSSLAALRETMTEEGYRNILVDAGDAIQGDTIGALTKGRAVVDLMNQTGYELAVPGNHEFDYKVDTFLELAEEEAEYTYISANFKEVQTNQSVFDDYQIKNVGGKKVAFVGISTPETYTKSSPAYFQNDEGEYIYTFCENEFYETIQASVDSALEEGADYVVAVGHTGIEGTTEEWKSTSIIANTTGIDVYLDAHSHETIENQICKNKEQKDVVLSSTGTKFENIGKLTIAADGTISTELIKTSEVQTDSTAGVQAAYNAVRESIDSYNQTIDEELKKTIGTSEVELTINGEDGERAIRRQETNMGDFVADAYRNVTGADIALVNGGGIRASIPAGDVSKKSLMDVNPWNNPMCVIEATGQQIVDALEHGAKNYPEESGGFLQVSGITYEINTTVTESPVITDDKGVFQSVEAGRQRRVQNVKVNGTPIDLTKTYTVAGSQYTLLEGGDGYSMFSENQVLQLDGLPADAEMLIQYFTENLNGIITEAAYGSAAGEGRIVITDKEPETPTDTPTEAPTETPTETPTDTPTETPAAAETTAPTDVPSTPLPPAGTTQPEPTTETITVKKAAISSLKNKGGRKVTVKWKKVSGAKGYQVQYSVSRKFTNKKVLNTTKTTVTLKKLKKGQKLYVRVRAYKKDADGKKVFGKFSKEKKITVKK